MRVGPLHAVLGNRHGTQDSIATKDTTANLTKFYTEL